MRHYDLPPLGQLEAFEAAARHLSFTRAAGELALTQSAVSRQIKALEDHFELPLFRRLHRALRLTEEGHALYQAVARPLRSAARGQRAPAPAHRAPHGGGRDDAGLRRASG